MTTATDFLKRRGHTWYVRVQVPKHFWDKAGTREYVRSLKTGDLSEANKLKHAHVAAFKRKIAGLEHSSGPDPLADVYEKALAYRDAMERHRGQVLFYEGDNPDQPYFATDEFLSQISDEARELLETHGEAVADGFFKVAKGEGTPLRDQIEPWLSEQMGTGQTLSQHRVAAERFLAWAGAGTLTEDVTRKKAGAFISHLLALDGGPKRRTVKRYASSLSSLWKWLIARGVIEDANPWLGQQISKKSKRGETPERRQWDDEAIVALLTGTYTPRYQAILHDLVKLALVTGARVDELCSLKNADVLERDDGWWIRIREGKTQAAVREIPVHDSVAHILKRRLKGSGEYLFAGLAPGGPDQKRSWNVTKAFSRYTQNLNLGEKRKVFHALRNTFAEAMEAAEVPLSTTQLIMGHKRASLTYGHYSKGERIKLRKYINRLRYSDAVMKLIRGSRPAQEKLQQAA